MSDYYEILGVRRDCTDEELKRAYKKLAMLHHPDKNQGVDEEKFKEINKAYETLKDPERRRMYDMGESASDFNPFDILRNMMPVQPSYNFTITLNEAYKGCTKKIKVNRKILCQQCRGDGTRDHLQPVICPRCNGNGISVTKKIFMNFLTQGSIICENCKGVGTYAPENIQCRQCKGCGQVSSSDTITFNIRPGIMDGELVKIERMGNETKKKIEDLIIMIRVVRDPKFIRNGNNLKTVCTLGLHEALITYRVNVKTLDDRILTLQLDNIVNSGDVYIVPGEGIPRGQGNLYVLLDLQVSAINEKDKKVLSKIFHIREEHREGTQITSCRKGNKDSF